MVLCRGRRRQSYLCLPEEGGGNQDSIILGEDRGSDSQGEGQRKILYQAYHILKKVKYAQMLTC
jgi:hypothetical protein